MVDFQVGDGEPDCDDHSDEEGNLIPVSELIDNPSYRNHPASEHGIY